jgi:hypothetical protein
VNGGAAGAVQLKVDVTGVSLGKASISLTAVANGELRIEGEALKAGDRIEIYRLSGSLVSVHEVSGRAVAIDVSHLAAGAYIVKEGKQAAKVTVK